MHTFDYFVGNLKCEKCGEVSPADRSTNIQTRIAVNTNRTPYGIGDEVDVDVGDITGASYLCVNKPMEPSTFTLVDSWECPTCLTPFNWVLISFENCRIVSMKAVRLDGEIGKIANYVKDDCEAFGWTVSGGNLVRVKSP